jgi:hypothetical protein
MSEARMAMFSAVICSQVWFASADKPFSVVWGSIWLAFAILMLYVSRPTPTTGEGQQCEP